MGRLVFAALAAGQTIGIEGVNELAPNSVSLAHAREPPKTSKADREDRYRGFSNKAKYARLSCGPLKSASKVTSRKPVAAACEITLSCGI
jgi:hypothetical protein